MLDPKAVLIVAVLVQDSPAVGICHERSPSAAGHSKTVSLAGLVRRSSPRLACRTPVRFLSDAELARPSGWPGERADADLITFFTLTGDDLGWLTANVRVENRPGAALQLCTLPWLGWKPDDLTACPSTAVNRVATQLGLASDDVPGLLTAYGGWEGRTRRDHRALVPARLGWRTSAAGDHKQLEAFLLARALEHDTPGVLLQLVCDWLRNERIVRPSMDTLSRRIAAARDGAHAETYHRLAPLLLPPRPARLDELLDVDDELGMTRLG